MEPLIVVHGGAGDIPDYRKPLKNNGVKKAVRIGYEILKNGGTSTDAVEAAVRYMEDDEAFNAGRGSVLNLDGEVEMDASIMVGENLDLGAVTVVKDIAHPISLARLVMTKTKHVLLAGDGAKRFAISQNVPILPPGSLVTDVARQALENYKKKHDDRTEIGTIDEYNSTKTIPSDVGTVGAVAIDCNGKLSAATSTGGYNGKMVGRCSDTSMVGSGVYADDFIGAISTTGHGETIAKFCLAHSIINNMRNGKSAQDATKESLEAMTERLKNTAGAITLSNRGDIGVYWTSKRMSWAYIKNNQLHYGLDHGEDHHEILA